MTQDEKLDRTRVDFTILMTDEYGNQQTKTIRCRLSESDRVREMLEAMIYWASTKWIPGDEEIPVVF